MFESWPFTNFHDLNLDWIIKTVMDLADRVRRVESEDLVQQSVDDTLQKWYDDGSLSSLLANAVHVKDESDFNTPANAYVLDKDIEVSKTINAWKQNVIIDLSGHIIKLVGFVDSTLFEYDDSTERNGHKQLMNGFIDMNRTAVPVITQGETWRTYINNVTIDNMVHTMIEYSGDGRGAECNFTNLTLIHADNADTSPALEIKFNDSVLTDIKIIKFKTGVILNGPANYLTNVHAWGYPRTVNAEYSENLITNKPFIVLKSNNVLDKCYADTPEPIDSSSAASYTNGGFGFYTAVPSTRFVSCYCGIHPESVYNNYRGFIVDDINPITLLSGYNYDNKIIGCCYSVDATNGQPLHGLPFDNVDNKTTVVASFHDTYLNHIARLESEYMDIGLPQVWRNKTGYICPYKDNNGNHFATVDGEYTAYLPPLFPVMQNSENTVLSKFRELGGYNPTARLPLFAIIGTTLYTYDYANDRLIKFTGSAV